MFLQVAVMTMVTMMVVVVMVMMKKKKGRRRKLPPSPARGGWPLLGHIRMFAGGMSAELVQEMRKLGEGLGPVVCFQLAWQPFIMVRSAAAAAEALLGRNGPTFGTRPAVGPAPFGKTSRRWIAASPSGPYVRAARRALSHIAVSPACVLAFRPVRVHVLDLLVARLLPYASAVPPRHVAVHATCLQALCHVLLAMCFGFVVEESDPRLAAAASHLEDAAAISLAEQFPFLSLLNLLDRRKRRLRRDVRSRELQLLTSAIDQHKQLRHQGLLIPGSYLENLLSLQEAADDVQSADAAGSVKEGGAINLSESDLMDLCGEFMLAATDTSANCIEWTMAHLMADPCIQAKLYDEIQHRVAGTGRPIAEEDLEFMPYLQAIVKETLRLHPPAPVTLPHGVTQACQLQGYDIPANAIVHIDITGLSRDGEAWEEPMQYRPERMLGIRDADILTGGNNISPSRIKSKGALISMLPFGAGSRACPGARLGLMHVQLFIARLVQEFSWRTVDARHPIDMSEELLFTLQMKCPLKALIALRPQPVSPNCPITTEAHASESQIAP